MKKWSLIIPYHNTEKDDRREQLNELLKSVPDRDGIEVICVDDHSTIAWKPDHIYTHTKLLLEKNPGPEKYAGAARNVGLRKANGDGILFADSDDLLDTENLENVLMELENEWETWDSAYFLMNSFTSTGKGDRHYKRNELFYQAQNGTTRSLLHYFSPAGRAIKADFLKRHDITFDTVRWGNDVLFSIKVAALCSDERVKLIEKVTYHIRSTTTSLINDNSNDSIKSRIETAAKANTFLKNTIDNPPLIHADTIAWSRTKGQIHRTFKLISYAKTLQGTQISSNWIWPVRFALKFFPDNVKRAIKAKIKS